MRAAVRLSETPLPHAVTAFAERGSSGPARLLEQLVRRIRPRWKRRVPLSGGGRWDDAFDLGREGIWRCGAFGNRWRNPDSNPFVEDGEGLPRPHPCDGDAVFGANLPGRFSHRDRQLRPWRDWAPFGGRNFSGRGMSLSPGRNPFLDARAATRSDESRWSSRIPGCWVIRTTKRRVEPGLVGR